MVRLLTALTATLLLSCGSPAKPKPVPQKAPKAAATADTKPTEVEEKASPAPFDWERPAATWWKQDAPCPDGGTLEKQENVPNPFGADRTIACVLEGRRHGPFGGWSGDSVMVTSGLYRDGKRHGEWLTWHPNGKLASRTLYADDAREGVLTTYYADGSKASETHYEGDLKHGLERLFNDAGRVAEELQYERGQRHGAHRTFHRNSRPALEVHFDQNVRHGRVTQWSEGGQELGSFQLDRGTGTWTTWHDNGKKAAEYPLKAGRRDGRITTWHDNGKKASEGTYAADAPSGTWKNWDSNGKPTETIKYAGPGQMEKATRYKDGKVSEISVFEPTSGRRLSQISYKGKRKQGEAKTWHKNGTLATTGEYKRGKKSGDWKIYSEAGQLEWVEVYRRGRRVKRRKPTDEEKSSSAGLLGVEACDRVFSKMLSCPAMPAQAKDALRQSIEAWKQSRAEAAAAGSLDAWEAATLKACEQMESGYKEVLKDMGC